MDRNDSSCEEGLIKGRQPSEVINKFSGLRSETFLEFYSFQVKNRVIEERNSVTE